MYTLKSWYFEASEDIITKFKSQGLYTIKIKYWNASGSGFPPSLIPALRNIGILHYKKAKLRKHLQHSVRTRRIHTGGYAQTKLLGPKLENKCFIWHRF